MLEVVNQQAWSKWTLDFKITGSILARVCTVSDTHDRHCYPSQSDGFDEVPRVSIYSACFLTMPKDFLPSLSRHISLFPTSDDTWHSYAFLFRLVSLKLPMQITVTKSFFPSSNTLFPPYLVRIGKTHVGAMRSN